VNLAFLGIQQDGAAACAGEIDSVIAGIENWRCARKGALARSTDKPETDLRCPDIANLPVTQAGARSGSQQPTPGAGPLSALSNAAPSLALR
jgi:hypothetical protein